MKNIKNAFSIIEVIIGIFIFSLGIASVYLLIISSLNMDTHNKNQVIAGNLAREGIELIRNIRDSNYVGFYSWNQKGPHLNHNNPDNFFTSNSYYKIENDFGSHSLYPIKVEDITVGFLEGKSNINSTSMQSYRLCLDIENRYTYDCTTPGNIKTNFYRYLKIDDLKYNDGGTTNIVPNGYRVTSKVIWTTKGYHELHLDTIIADFKRL